MAGNIVVGVDDSASSRAALRMAAHEAALRGAGLRTVHVWLGGTAPERRAGSALGQPPRTWLTHEVASLQARRAMAGGPAVAVAIDVVEGEAETERCAAARSAALLVLGARHHRGPSAVLSSVSERCAAHPPCPVLIVPPARTERG